MMVRRQWLDDKLGCRFGSLTVIGRAVKELRDGHRAVAVVRCDCGVEKQIRPDHLRSGSTTSCGCERGKALYKHGLSGTPEHRIWCGMMTRCYWSKPGDRNYRLYRGAGVIVADRWHEFENFLADMGPRPSPKHSLDRFPNQRGNYEPGNVRWATSSEQCNNTRSNVLIEHGGKRQTIADWAAETGISRCTIRQRLHRGWPVDRALRGRNPISSDQPTTPETVSP